MTQPNGSVTYPVAAQSLFSQQASNYVDLSPAAATSDLMNQQLTTNTPQPSSDVFSIVSDPLLPDRSVTDRLGHMDPDIYDLSPNSNLIKLFTALLGGAGVGGLRKQTVVARLENAFATTHFLDLDRFYGALFGIVRTQAEVMPDFGALTDDSGTLPQAQPAQVTYTLHKDSDFASAVAGGTGTAYTLGEMFEVTSPILVSALRYWRVNTSFVASSMGVFDVATGALVPGSQVTPGVPPATTGWHTTTLPSSLLLPPGRYWTAGEFPAGYTFANGFFGTAGLMPASTVLGPVRFLSQADATNGLQSAFTGSSTLTCPTTQAGNGALLGVDLVFTPAAPVGTAGGVQFDPYTDAAGSDVWDDVHSRDASYRARLVKFAAAIPQGGTYPGLLAAAEAILGVECELYESWEWVDELADHGGVALSTGYNWHQVETGFKSWGAVERGHTWGTFGGRVLTLGRTGTSNRSEVQLQPKRALRIDEQFEIVRVLEKLMPAGVSITVDPDGLAVHEQTAIRGVAADSEYWEVISKVVPNQATTGIGGQSVYQVTDPGAAQPRPAFSQYQGECWTYNTDVSTVASYELEGSRVLTASDFEHVVYGDGSAHDYVPSDALVPGVQTAAARACADGVLTSYPYCAPRAQQGGAIR